MPVAGYYGHHHGVIVVLTKIPHNEILYNLERSIFTEIQNFTLTHRPRHARYCSVNTASHQFDITNIPKANIEIYKPKVNSQAEGVVAVFNETIWFIVVPITALRIFKHILTKKVTS